jgi:hypothetical protein
MTCRRCLASPAGYPAGPQLFLDFDDRLGVLQSPPEPCILPLGLRQFHRQRIPRHRLWPPLGRCQRIKSAAVALPAPVRQARRVQAFPAQDRSDPANLGGTVNLGQNAKLRLRRKSPTPGPIQHLGRRRRRGRHCRRPPASLRINSSGTVRFPFFAWHDHVMVVLRPQG